MKGRVMIGRAAAVAFVIGLGGSLAAWGVGAECGDEYWPWWRGPKGTGVAEKGNPPMVWSETKNIKWKVRVPGQGTSSPIVWGDKIFFQTAIETDKHGAVSAGEGGAADACEPKFFHGGRRPKKVYRFDVVCMDRGSGKIVWQRTVREELPHEGHHPVHGFASYSPVTDGKCVWASFGSRGVHCYDVEGNHKWSRDLG
ncbi:MAG: PQQ-binding-like beta-propeller repeat protein, partial [Planctomycetota bacterium]